MNVTGQIIQRAAAGWAAAGTEGGAATPLLARLHLLGRGRHLVRSQCRCAIQRPTALTVARGRGCRAAPAGRNKAFRNTDNVAVTPCFTLFCRLSLVSSLPSTGHRGACSNWPRLVRPKET